MLNVSWGIVQGSTRVFVINFKVKQKDYTFLQWNSISMREEKLQIFISECFNVRFIARCLYFIFKMP